MTTEPSPIPQPTTGIPADWLALPTFCSRCEVHRATSTQPLCPVCVDRIRRGEEEW